MSFIQNIRNLIFFTNRENWIPEDEAAQQLYRNPVLLRRLAKNGDLPVSFKKGKDRSYEYSRRDIQKYLQGHTFYRSGSLS